MDCDKQIGFFGMSGDKSGSKSTLTHIVNIHGDPICGTHILDKKVFQWCGSAGALLPECKNCLKIYRKGCK